MLGGLLFGLLLGSFVVVVAATVGASIVFFAVRTALRDPLNTKAKGSIEKMRRGFDINYLLVLRLISIFLFFIINIAAGMLGVKFRDFFWVNFIIFVYVI